MSIYINKYIYIYIYIYLETDLCGPVLSGWVGGQLAVVRFRGMPHGAFALSRYLFYHNQKDMRRGFRAMTIYVRIRTRAMAIRFLRDKNRIA